MRPGHLRFTAESALVISALLDPLEVDCRAPISGPDSHHGARQRISGLVHTRFLRRRREDLFHPVVGRGLRARPPWPFETSRKSEA